MASHSDKDWILEQLLAAVDACRADAVLRGALPAKSVAGRDILIAAGKAAMGMAGIAVQELESAVHGMVVARRNHGENTAILEAAGLKLFEATHPVPGAGSEAAARYALQLAQGAGPQDRMIFLFSGGASSLLAAPLPGLDMAMKADVVRHMLRSGADITQINRLRAYISAVKGGRLGAAASRAGARHTLLISDVVGDDAAAIASGPTVEHHYTRADALSVLDAFHPPHAAQLRAVIESAELPRFDPGDVQVLASGAAALQVLAERLARAGFTVRNMGAELVGEARLLGEAHGKLAAQIYDDGADDVALISGGEVTVTIAESTAQDAKGGPALEYLAGLMPFLAGRPGLTAAAIDSDGLDGHGGHAGGYVSDESLMRADARSLDVDQMMAKAQSYHLFKEIDGLYITGPTGTNVNDVRVILIRRGKK